MRRRGAAGRIAPWLRRLLLVGGLVFAALWFPAAAQAHPLGNFTTNHYSELRVSPDGVRVDYVLDLAELPTYQARRTGGLSASTVCASAASSATLRVAERSVPLRVESATGRYQPGTAGLDTWRLECRLSAPAEIEPSTAVSYRDGLYPDRVGWREIVAVGDGVTLTSSDVPAVSRSRALTKYPADLLADPPVQRTASLVASPGGGSAQSTDALPAAADSRGIDALTTWFTEFVGRPQLTWTLGILAVLISVLLGAVHALAPGHGKTVMAAFLVGERGSMRQAGVIALTVTLTHTAGVLVLGIVLTTSVVLAPERLYAWLGVASGLLLAGVGFTLLRRSWSAVRGRRAAVRMPVRELAAVGAVHSSVHTDEHVHADGHAHSHAAAHSHAPVHASVHSGALVEEAVHSHGGVGTAVHTHGAGDAAVHTHGDHEHTHAHDTDHDHADTHEHGDGWHDHGDGHRHRHDWPDQLSLKGLVAMGFAGGLVPSPSALVVLLGAVALGRTWFGVLLVVGYGAGMACTLTGVGFALARWRVAIERRSSGRVGAALKRFLPVVTASLIVLVGIGLAARAAASF